MYVGVSYSTVFWPRDEKNDETDDEIYRMGKIAALIISKGHEVWGENVFYDWYDESSYPGYFNIRVGEGFVGAIRTMYMWEFPKTIGTMRMSQRHNLPIREQCDPFAGMSYPECQTCD